MSQLAFPRITPGGHFSADALSAACSITPPACIVIVDQAEGVVGYFAFQDTAAIAYIEKP